MGLQSVPLPLWCNDDVHAVFMYKGKKWSVKRDQLWFLNMKHVIKFNIYKLTGPLILQITPISIKATRRIIIRDLK